MPFNPDIPKMPEGELRPEQGDALAIPQETIQKLADELVEAAGGDRERVKEAFEKDAAIVEQEKNSGVERLEDEYYRSSMNVDLSFTFSGMTANLFSFPFAFGPIADAMEKGLSIENTVAAIVLAIGPTVVGFGIDWIRDITKNISFRREYAVKRIALAGAERAEG